jgi:hypothetical protein
MEFPMKRLALFCLVATLLASCANSKRIAYLKNPLPPDSVKPATIDLAAYEKKYSKYDGVYLDREYTLEHFGSKGSWEFFKVYRLRFLVLNPDAEWLTTFSFEEDPGEELQKIYINVTSPDGTTHTYGYNDLKEERSGDKSRRFKFAYPNVRKGSIIEEGYEAKQDASYSSLDQDLPLQFNVPCEHLSVRYAYPDWWSTRVKNIASSTRLDYKQIHDDENSKTILSYEASDIPAVAREPYAPFFKEIGKYMEVMVTQMEMANRYTSYFDWAQLGRSFAHFALDKESFWSSRLESTVEEITEGKTSEYEKIDAIVRYVQKNIKIGDSDDDDNFADVLKKKEGNIYLVNGLTRAMLEEAKIHSLMLLIHDARDGYFDMSYVSPDQLYIPAVSATTTDGKSYIVFPYMKNLPAGLIPDHFQGQKAMRISQGGFEGFEDIPEGLPLDNTVDDNYTLAIDEEGQITITEEKTLRGSNAYSMREYLSDVTKEEMEKEMKDLLTYSEGDVKLKKYEIENQDDYQKPLIIRFNYRIDNLVTVTPEEVIFQTGGLFSPSTNNKWKVDTDDRQLPIRIYNDERLDKNITIKHPSNWTLSTELSEVDFKNIFGTIHGSYKALPGELHITQSRTLNKASEPKEKADDLLAVTGRRSQLYIPSLVFKVNQQP